jgi:hypothetical protein
MEQTRICIETTHTNTSGNALSGPMELVLVLAVAVLMRRRAPARAGESSRGSRLRDGSVEGKKSDER